MEGLRGPLRARLKGGAPLELLLMATDPCLLRRPSPNSVELLAVLLPEEEEEESLEGAEANLFGFMACGEAFFFEFLLRMSSASFRYE